MKKGKLLALLSVLMIAAMLLSSCGGAKKISKVSSFEKVLNSEYDYAQTVVDAAKALTELDGYVIGEKTGEFVLFVKEGESVAKVFSFRSGSVVMTLADSGATSYDVVVSDEPIFVVCKTVGEEAPTYTAYDATGAELITTKYELAAPRAFGNLVLYGNALYSMDEEKTGKLTKELDVPETLLIQDEEVLYSESYFYLVDVKAAEYVKIFDRELNYITSWYAPSAAEGVKFATLNNGDVLVQYVLALDPYAEEYDFYESDDGETVKCDLVTKLIAAKNGKVTDVDMDYMISYVMSVYEMEEWFDEDIFADKAENIAYIYPIVDKQVDYSDSASDIVLMSNKGKIQKSVKLVDGQYAKLPALVGDDLYLVDTMYGRALTDAKGKVQHAINNGFMSIVGGYIIGETAIYDLSMEKVYDLRENSANVLTTIGDTVFVMKGEDTELAYEVIAFCDGEQKTVATFNAEADSSTIFMGIENADCYAVLDTASAEYTYYNAAGKELMKTSVLLVATTVDGQDTVLLSGVNGETTVYYALTK